MYVHVIVEDNLKMGGRGGYLVIGALVIKSG